MENFIPILNKIQDAFNAVGSEGLKLPQIVAIGSQSSGKSSILESLVGRGFLPRGFGIVTRCPLVLQMINVPETDTFHHPRPGVTEWARFLHKNRIFEDWDMVRNEILEETKRLSGSSKGISSTPINLKVYSPKVPTLTLVDLPGITKVPVGDQPEDIEARVKAMLMQYISNPNSIILAVAAANTDFATSESLKLALEVDPNGDRTLVVVTKLDLMDAGTDATDLLTGQIIPIKLGIIGVVNRSQQDIMDSKSGELTLKKEREFLETKYPHLANISGTSYLAQKLTQLLSEHIKACLPALRSRIHILTSQYKAMQESCGEVVEKKEKVVMSIINKYSQLFIGTVNGTSDEAATPSAINGVIGGATICDIFNIDYAKEMNTLNPIDNLQTLEILTAIKNASGPSPSLFVTEPAFIHLMSRQTKQLERPSLNCVQSVYEELTRVAEACEAALRPKLIRFPHLQHALREEVRDILQSRLGPTQQLVSNLVGIQTDYINTRHPDFVVTPSIFKSAIEVAIPGFDADGWTNVTGANNNPTVIEELVQHPLPKGPHKLPNHDKLELCIIIELITLYFRTVQRTIQDCVPKSIMHQMVNYLLEHLQEELTLRILKPELLDDLLAETPQVAERRQEAKKMLNLLQQVSQIVAEVKRF